MNFPMWHSSRSFHPIFIYIFRYVPYENNHILNERMANVRIIWCVCVCCLCCWCRCFCCWLFFVLFIFISLFVNVRYLLLLSKGALCTTAYIHAGCTLIGTYHTLLSSIVIIIIIIWFPNQFIRCSHQQTIFSVFDSVCVCVFILNCICNYNNSITKWLLLSVRFECDSCWCWCATCN